jgi:hypothetical protein
VVNSRGGERNAVRCVEEVLVGGGKVGRRSPRNHASVVVIEARKSNHLYLEIAIST